MIGQKVSDMDLQLRGKSVLVTGSTRGIGFAIANAFLAEGADVAFNSRTVTNLKDCVAPTYLGRAISAPGDVSDPEQANRVIEHVLSEFSKIDVLICNVGGGRSVSPGMETYCEWNKVFGLNLWSATNVVEAATMSLVSTGGTIVCISSICGYEFVPGAPITYSVAKAALHAYVRGISRPLGRKGVRINAIAPGNILFDGSVWQQKLEVEPLAVQEMLQRHVSLTRLGTAQEIANLAVWLCSPFASFCTGSIFVADGGQVHS